MVCCKGKGWRVEGDHKGGKKQDDDEICGGMCLVCGGGRRS